MDALCLFTLMILNVKSVDSFTLNSNLTKHICLFTLGENYINVTRDDVLNCGRLKVISNMHTHTLRFTFSLQLYILDVVRTFMN